LNNIASYPNTSTNLGPIFSAEAILAMNTSFNAASISFYFYDIEMFFTA
jgi:hypothetical protein